ncbi:MAG: hypothetical protein ACI9YR_000350, partial [Bacteroidia bacterium]
EDDDSVDAAISQAIDSGSSVDSGTDTDSDRTTPPDAPE